MDELADEPTLSFAGANDKSGATLDPAAGVRD